MYSSSQLQQLMFGVKINQSFQLSSVCRFPYQVLWGIQNLSHDLCPEGGYRGGRTSELHIKQQSQRLGQKLSSCQGRLGEGGSSGGLDLQTSWKYIHGDHDEREHTFEILGAPVFSILTKSECARKKNKSRDWGNSKAQWDEPGSGIELPGLNSGISHTGCLTLPWDNHSDSTALIWKIGYLIERMK